MVPISATNLQGSIYPVIASRIPHLLFFFIFFWFFLSFICSIMLCNMFGIVIEYIFKHQFIDALLFYQQQTIFLFKGGMYYIYDCCCIKHNSWFWWFARDTYCAATNNIERRHHVWNLSSNSFMCLYRSTNLLFDILLMYP